MRWTWAICACTVCAIALTAAEMADFPLLLVLTAMLTMAFTWL